MFSLGPEKVLGNILLGNLDALCEMVSSGRSGSFFFKSNDGKYLIKTLPADEHYLLQRILPSYLEHFTGNPNTLLTRFFGLHSMKCGSEKDIYFVVMGNLFDSPLKIHEQYDLKGSTIGRHVDVDDSQDLSDIALKDNDFTRRIILGPGRKGQLLEQIEKDIRWLEKHQICDYSFLLGFHFLSEEEKLSLPAVIDSRNLGRNTYGGIISEDRNAIYFMGIIDTLTLYNIKKMTERLTKRLLGNDANQISAIDPSRYRIRFLHYVNSIID